MPLAVSAALSYVVAAVLVLPLFAPEVWSGFRLALPNDVLAIVAPTEQPLSVRSPGGEWAVGLALVWFAVAYWRRNASWWQGALVVLGTTAALVRAGNLWLDGVLLIAPLGRQLSCLRMRTPLLGIVAAAGLSVSAATAWSSAVHHRDGRASTSSVARHQNDGPGSSRTAATDDSCVMRAHGTRR